MSSAQKKQRSIASLLFSLFNSIQFSLYPHESRESR